MHAFALFYSNVQTELRAWLRDFRVRIILTFAPHGLEKSQVEKAGGKKVPSAGVAGGVWVITETSFLVFHSILLTWGGGTV